MSRDCEKCGWDLEGSDYTMPWEDDDNEYGYYICRHCHHKNEIIEDDDD